MPFKKELSYLHILIHGLLILMALLFINFYDIAYFILFCIIQLDLFIYSNKKQFQFQIIIMARITVEDCIKQINNQYELVILAKERAVQLGRGAAPAVDPENDKKPVIALREIGESKITAEELHDSIIGKLRQVSDYQEEEETDVIEDDTFRQMYQGGLSKSEMEKTATRKFTSRTPRIDTKPVKAEEVVVDKSSIESDINNDELIEPDLENEVNDIDSENVENIMSEDTPNEIIEDISANSDEEKTEFSDEIIDNENKVSEESSLASDVSEEDNNNNS
jgi:DNA-directed RNA polymerase subunit omega